MIFWTADHHFLHKHIIEYCNRLFEDLNQMHKVLIGEWNKVVRDGDLVWHLGDFGFGSKQMIMDIRDQLNGSITLLKGNHDRSIKGWVKKAFILVYDNNEQPVEIEIEGIKIVMAHRTRQMFHLDHDDYDLLLHGHSHGESNIEGKYFDVGVDNCPNFAPVSLEQILKIMKERNER